MKNRRSLGQGHFALAYGDEGPTMCRRYPHFRSLISTVHPSWAVPLLAPQIWGKQAWIVGKRRGNQAPRDES
jgi:hypothetical protein